MNELKEVYDCCLLPGPGRNSSGLGRNTVNVTYEDSYMVMGHPSTLKGDR